MDGYSIGELRVNWWELAATVMIDATVRLLPDVLGNDASAAGDSHSTGLLEHPQYTRPREYKRNGSSRSPLLVEITQKLQSGK